MHRVHLRPRGAIIVSQGGWGEALGHTMTSTWAVIRSKVVVGANPGPVPEELCDLRQVTNLSVDFLVGEGKILILRYFQGSCQNGMRVNMERAYTMSMRTQCWPLLRCASAWG